MSLDGRRRDGEHTGRAVVDVGDERAEWDASRERSDAKLSWTSMCM